ncbi:MAG TPA: Fmu (Sun) domain-containing protein [Chitinophagaceae bacterium]|nr:Fmu (Sun) domain-containing protein [Chitinophagaceae bacterium]
MFVQAYLKVSQDILASYKGEEPFSSFLKKFFAHHKKFGSRDRKNITGLCYGYFRLGKALLNLEPEDRLIIGSFLCSHQTVIVDKLRPEWAAYSSQPLSRKIELVSNLYGFKAEDIFMFRDQVSEKIDLTTFSESFLIQPDAHLRIRPGRKRQVISKLAKAGVSYVELSDSSLALPAATKLQDFLLVDDEIVIQDFSSQRVIAPVKSYLSGSAKLATAWDCCAGSGGKSILIKDSFPGVSLTVTDIRTSIIQNLKNRFAKAGIQQFNAFVADVGEDGFSLNQQFDLVLCDVPCTGSGTWGRTPEQLFFFKEDKIGYYSELQKRILVNAVKSVARGGLLLYSTCSVFKEENEAIVAFIKEISGFKLQVQQYFTGYELKGDSLFAALFVSEL